MKDVTVAKPALALKCLLVGLKAAEKAVIKKVIESMDSLIYEFQYAGSGIESLFKVRSFQPGAVFIDEALVDDADDLIGQIRKINRKPVIWIVVSQEVADKALHYIELGAADVIVKAEIDSPRLQRMIVSTSVRIAEDASASSVEDDRLVVRLKTLVKSLANSFQTLTWMADERGERFLFNEKWLSFTGRKLEQELDKKWLENVHTQDVQKLWAAYSKAIQTQSSYHVEYRLRRNDKQYRLILESASPLLMPDGKFIGLHGSCTDISDTRLTKHQIPLIQTPPNLSTTLDHAPIGIWKLNDKLVITKANPAVGVLLNLQSESLIGKAIKDVLPAIPEAAFVSVLDKGERVQLENHPVKVGSARGMIFLDVAAWPLKDEKSKIVGVCISTTEVTRRHNQAQQREDFIATLVHDLKTPLIGADRTLDHMIDGALGALDPNQVEVLTMLKRSNHNLLAMVQNLIEVYRYEAGETKLLKEPLSLFELINNSLAEMNAWASERQITFQVKVLSSLGPIMADRLAIRRVFLNLVDNALKFTKAGGQITIQSYETDEYVELRVIDTGVGISETELPLLFSRFYQTESGRTRAMGSGLGLYLCRQIITAHGGTISAQSQLDHGSTFTIKFPKEFQSVE